MVYLSQEKPLQGPLTQVNYEYERQHWPGFQAELERQGK